MSIPTVEVESIEEEARRLRRRTEEYQREQQRGRRRLAAVPPPPTPAPAPTAAPTPDVLTRATIEPPAAPPPLLERQARAYTGQEQPETTLARSLAMYRRVMPNVERMQAQAGQVRTALDVQNAQRKAVEAASMGGKGKMPGVPLAQLPRAPTEEAAVARGELGGTPTGPSIVKLGLSVVGTELLTTAVAALVLKFPTLAAFMGEGYLEQKGIIPGKPVTRVTELAAGSMSSNLQEWDVPKNVADFVAQSVVWMSVGKAPEAGMQRDLLAAFQGLSKEDVGKAIGALRKPVLEGERGALGREGAVPPEKPPPPPEPVTPPAPQAPRTLATKMATVIRSAKTVQETAEVLKHEAHARQMAAMADVLKNEKYTDQEAFEIAAGLRKGEIVPKSFDLPEGTFTAEELAQGDAAIRYFDWGGKPHDAVNARLAFVKATSGIKPYPYEIGLLERVFGSDVAKALISKRPMHEKLLGFFGDLLFGVPRTMQTMLDFSAQLRQLALVTARHPKETLGNMWGANIIPFFSEARAAAIDKQLRQIPLELTEEGAQGGWNKLFHAELGATAGLAEREELMASHLLIEGVKVKGVTLRMPGGKESARAFTTIVNKARKDIYLTIARKWQGTGKTLEDYLALADLINKGTGRGSFGPFGGELGQKSAMVFYAPRLVLSRVEHPALMVLSRSPAVRRLAAEQVVSFVAANTALLSVLKLSGVADVELDPRSTDFGKIRIGPTRIDPWGGWQPIARQVVQFAWGSRKATSGYTMPVNRATVAWRAAQSKLNPGAGLLVDLMEGTTFVGEEVSASPSAIRTQVYNRLTPLFIQDMVDAIQTQGFLGGILAVPGAFGVGVQTYETPFDRITQTENQILNELGHTRKEMEDNPGIAAQVHQDERWQTLRRQLDADAKAHGAPLEYRFGAFSREVRDTIRNQQTTDDQRLINWWKGEGTGIAPSEWRAKETDRNSESFNRIDAIKNALGIEFEEDKATPDTVRAALDSYYGVEVADYTDPGTGAVDWEGYMGARESALAVLSPEDRQWADKAIHQYDTPLETEYRQDQPKFDPYLNVSRTLWKEIAPNKVPLEDAITLERDRLTREHPDQDITRAEAIAQLSFRMPEVGQYYDELADTKYNYRWDNPETEAYLYKWGIIDKILSPAAAEMYHSWFGRWPDDFDRPPSGYENDAYLRP